jgi:hypothetical protein
VLAWAFSGVALKNAGVPVVAWAAWAATGVTILAAGVALVHARR